MQLAQLLSTNALAILDDARALEIDAEVRGGLDLSTATKLLAARKVPPELHAQVLTISRRTLQRKVAGEGKLSKVEGGALVEVIRVIDRATQVLGSLDDAIEWMQRRIISLGGKRPFDLIDTPIGRREVERVLGRIEHGVY